jgi:hypothetical protein
MVGNNGRAGTIKCCKHLISRLDSQNVIFSAITYTGLDILSTSEDYLGVWKKGNPPCNAEDKLRAGLLVIEARFRGY